jgi:hypothetical protein
MKVSEAASLATACACALALGSSCHDEHNCSKLGCHDTFTIGFHKTSDWVDGKYAIALDIDGEAIECSFSVPIPEDPQTVCPGGSGIEFWVYRATTADPFLPAGVVIPGSPELVSIAVSQAQTTLAEDTFEVGDDRVYPNGPECDGGCLDAKASLDFDGSAGGAGGAGGEAGSAGS